MLVHCTYWSRRFAIILYMHWPGACLITVGVTRCPREEEEEGEEEKAPRRKTQRSRIRHESDCGGNSKALGAIYLAS